MTKLICRLVDRFTHRLELDNQVGAILRCELIDLLKRIDLLERQLADE